MNYIYYRHWVIPALTLFCGCLLFSCNSHIQNAPEGFQVNSDFMLERVAAEPLVFDPVDMEFDDKGRAFVLEMPGYPLRDEESRLILLEDEDGDGVFDKRTLFADNLYLASSFMPYKDGMLVASPPNLLFLKDIDGDNQADQVDTLMKGFRVGNLQHNYNGLTYGIDNWIYAANGGNSGAPHFVERPEDKLSIRGEDFRMNLEEKIMERIGESSGGFELAFDNWGRMYETHNLEHVSQLVFEGNYIGNLPLETSHSLTLISDHDENGLSRIYPIGEQETRVNHPEQSGYFSGSCGISFYGGGAFPQVYNDNLFVADVVLNLIHMDVLSDKGTHSVASRHREKAEFIACKDRSFRPVNLTTGPDGALYILDMHRAVIEHPEWIPDELEKELDLADGKEKGRIYRLIPRSGLLKSDLRLDKHSSETLVEALASSNQWMRMTAQRLLVEKNGAEAISLLKTALEQSENEYMRLHAMWTLQGIDKLENKELRHLLGDIHPGVRENAIRIAESYLNQDPELAKILIGLTKDQHPRVRMRAALALGKLDDEYFASYAREIFYAFQDMLSEEDADIWLSMASATAMQKQALTFSRQILNHAESQIAPYQKTALVSLCKLLAGRSDLIALEVLLKNLESHETLGQEDKGEVIDAIAENWVPLPQGKRPSKAIENTLASMESQGEIGLLKASGKLRKSLDIPASSQISKLLAGAGTEVFEETKPIEERVELVQLLGLTDFDQRSPILYKLLDNRQPQALQKEALQQLWEANNPEIAAKLLALWPDLGPEARKGVGNILLYKSAHHDLLLTAIETKKINMGELNLDLERRRVLLWSEEASVKQRAEKLFSDAGVVQRKAAMENMRPALTMPGDINAGKKQFQLLCANCHQYGAIGKQVGPVLTEINRKSKASLLHDILDPNAAVDTKYLNHSLKTKDGQIYTGIVFAESDSEVQLKMTDGIEKRVPKNNIEKLSSLGISLMPEGLESEMTQEDMADLLAFLQQQP